MIGLSLLGGWVLPETAAAKLSISTEQKKYITLKEDRGQERRYHDCLTLLTSQSAGSASPQKSSPRCTFEQSLGLGCCLSPPFCQTVEVERQMEVSREKMMKGKETKHCLINKYT